MKNLKSLGKTLSIAEQKTINGGGRRLLGISDGECDQATQSRRRCTGYNVGCDLDAYCNAAGFCQCDV